MLRSIAGHAQLPASGTPPNVGLFFITDAPFLRAFHVMIYSMVKTSSLLDLPVTIITTDAAVATDPVVRACADRVRVLTEQELAPFREIDTDHVSRNLRHKVVPKYSFLKWFAFEDYGYEQNIYLDVDMLCLGNCDDLATAYRGCDLASAPKFPSALRRKDGDRLEQETVDHNLQSFVASAESWDRRINSGVLVLGHRMMQPEVRAELFAIREQEHRGFDQGVLHSWMKRHGEVRTRWLPPVWNFNHGFLSEASAIEQVRLLGQIRILHYIGYKPWDIRLGRRLSSRLWRLAEANAEEHFRLLELKGEQQAIPLRRRLTELLAKAVRRVQASR